VLTEASVNGAVDRLRGLKENVIIGRLIPANLESSREGRKRLGMDIDDWEQDALAAPQLTLETEAIGEVPEFVPGDNDGIY